MIRPKKDKVATELFVWMVVNRLREELEARFEESEAKAEARFNKVIEHLDSIAGQFRKFDEERVVMVGIQRNHEDRLEKLEKAVFKVS